MLESLPCTHDEPSPAGTCFAAAGCNEGIQGWSRLGQAYKQACSFSIAAIHKKCLQEMILIVLMVVWTGYVDIHPKRPLDLIEFFAGHAAIARNGVVSGYRCAALDLDFDSMRDPQRRLRLDKRSPFDLNSDSGFARLTWYNAQIQNS